MLLKITENTQQIGLGDLRVPALGGGPGHVIQIWLAVLALVVDDTGLNQFLVERRCGCRPCLGLDQRLSTIADHRLCLR